MNIDKKALIGIITEIEASRERAKGETRHQSEILKKAKEQNFDTKAIRKVLQRRAMSEGDRESQDIAIETYERAMGSLAHAQEAVDEGRMSAREAAEHYSVPRGALATVTRGAKNGISEPAPKPEDGDDGITESCGERAGTRSPNQSREETARYDGDARNQANSAVVGPPARFDSGPHDAATKEGDDGLRSRGGIAPDEPEVARVAPPVSPSANEAPATPSVGAGLTPLATKMLGVFPKAGDVNDQNDGDSGRSAAVRVGDPPQSGGVLLDSASVHAGECAASPQAAATADTSAHQGASQPTGTPGASVSVGAVASESERVAPTYPDEDPGPPPAFLRRTSAQGRVG